MDKIAPAAESVPDWENAKPRWGKFWEVHCFGLGVAFGLLALNSVVSLLRSIRRKRFAQTLYVIAINALLMVLGGTRASYLLYDPYESEQRLATWLSQLLFNVSFPCLTSAFCLILYVFMSVTKLQLVSKKLENVSFFLVVIAFHFTVVLVAVILSVLNSNIVTIIFIFCHMFFIVWGLVLSAGFIFSWIKIIRSLKTASERLLREHRSRASAKVAKDTLLTSFLGVACSILHVYSLFIVYCSYCEQCDKPEPWMWWGFKTCFRIIEIAMACNISYCIMQPSDSSKARSSTAS